MFGADRNQDQVIPFVRNLTPYWQPQNRELVGPRFLQDQTIVLQLGEPTATREKVNLVAYMGQLAGIHTTNYADADHKNSQLGSSLLVRDTVGRGADYWTVRPLLMW